jgi:hypothetical protein
MNGTLCNSCLAIPQELFFDMNGAGIKTLHLHHTSVKNLQNSAKNGCHVCGLFSSTISASPFRNEAHRTYFKVDGMRGMYPNPYRNLLSYRVGQDGLSYLFDVETSGMKVLSTFQLLLPLQRSILTHDRRSILQYAFSQKREGYVGCIVLDS